MGEEAELELMMKDLLKKFVYESTNDFISKEIWMIIHEWELNLAVAPLLIANPNDPPENTRLD